ncbi:MAG: ATP-binding protein [Phormidesmis sp.]
MSRLPSSTSVTSDAANTFRLFSRRAGLIVISIGLAALLGWTLDIDVLKSVIPGRVTLKPNTAIGLIANGLALSLWHQQQQSSRRTRRLVVGAIFLLCFFVIALGLVTLAEYSFGLDFGVDQFLFEASPSADDAIIGGRPAPNTAISLVLTGSALLLLLQKRYRVAQGVSIAVFAGGLLALVGHLHAATIFYQVGTVTGMAIHTAISFGLLSLGIFCARPDRGWMIEVSGDYAGSIMLRRILPWAIILPSLLGGFVLLVFQRLSLPFENAFALRTVLSIVFFSIVIGWNGQLLNRMDSHRQAVQQQFSRELEVQVMARTAELNAANEALRIRILEREQTEAKLRESENALQESQIKLQRELAEIESIYQSAPVGLNVLDPDLRFVRINQRLAEMNGFSIEEHIGRTVAELLPDLADSAEQLLRPIFETGQPRLNVEIRGETPAQPGIERIWLEHFLPLKDGDRTIGVNTVCEEITERKRTEQALYEQAAQQAAVARIGRQAIAIDRIEVLLDSATTQVAQVLEADYCEVLELSADKQELKLRSGIGWQPGMIGWTTFRSDRKSWAGYTLSSMETIVVTDSSAETRFVSPLLDPHEVVSGMSTVIGSTGDHPFGVLGVHTRTQRNFSENDVNFLQAIANILFEAITRRKAEQQIRQSNADLERRIAERTQQLSEVNRELEAFAYSVAHDLRAPLRAIEGFAGILKEDYSSSLDKTGQQYTQILIDSASRLDQLIQDLLDYSQLGRRDIQLVSVNLSTLVERILRELAPTIAAQPPPAQPPQIEVVGPLPFAQAQRGILRQVISNLLANAVKFVPAERTPMIHIWAEERIEESTNQQIHWVRLWVEDNGIGIPERYRDRIFRPFERLQGIDQYPGTGIGLAIVQRGVERMNGQVGVESAPGGGSRFWIELRRS